MARKCECGRKACPSQFFKDDAGEFSIMRLQFFLVAVVVLGFWIWGMIQAGEYISLGWQEVALLTGNSAAKALQAKFEYEE